MGIREKLEEFVSKLEYARSTGDNKYRARCPAHNDKSPSLDIQIGRTGAIIMICRSHGCAPKDIMESVGMSENDLFPDDPYTHREGFRRPKNWVPEDDEFIVRIGLDQPRNQFSKQDWEKFQGAVKRESRRLNCNALEFYKNNTWSREA